ncbi:hypothetical protein BXZ70DRAFT_904359 [Cristinia sonorae]|uniref:Uncharacterized protein n=1 Tax=Cristinia sonorae TaxID=1940300 RepID=A0A8K0UUJ2_9AGAR|nr:hypothetical protein BXZ70DRAFT_904359 [Cristinia sonorae]
MFKFRFTTAKNASTSSLASTATFTSTSTVTTQTQPTPTSPPPPQKDFSAALASLQSEYGFGGAAPMRIPDSPKSTTRKAAKGSKGGPTSASQASPLPAGAKDYEASLAALQSTYGFGGTAPSRPSTSSSSSPPPRETNKSDGQASQPVTGVKDYEATFGAMQASYGFGGGLGVELLTIPLLGTTGDRA